MGGGEGGGSATLLAALALRVHEGGLQVVDLPPKAAALLHPQPQLLLPTGRGGDSVAYERN